MSASMTLRTTSKPCKQGWYLGEAGNSPGFSLFKIKGFRMKFSTQDVSIAESISGEYSVQFCWTKDSVITHFGIAIAANMKELFDVIDCYGDPYSVLLRSDYGSICIELESEDGDFINPETSLDITTDKIDDEHWWHPIWDKSETHPNKSEA